MLCVWRKMLDALLKHEFMVVQSPGHFQRSLPKGTQHPGMPQTTHSCNLFSGLMIVQSMCAWGEINFKIGVWLGMVGHLWCIYSPRCGYPNKQESCCSWDLCQEGGCWRGALVSFKFMKPYMMWRLEDWGYRGVSCFCKLPGNAKTFCAFAEYFVKMNLDKELICIWAGLDLSKNILCYRKTLNGLLVGPREVTLDLRWSSCTVFHDHVLALAECP
jgi:hypothetical protein